MLLKGFGGDSDGPRCPLGCADGGPCAGGSPHPRSPRLPCRLTSCSPGPRARCLHAMSSLNCFISEINWLLGFNYFRGAEGNAASSADGACQNKSCPACVSIAANPTLLKKKKGISPTPDKAAIGQEKRNKLHRARSCSRAEEGREATGIKPAVTVPAPTTDGNKPVFKDTIKVIKLPRRSHFGCVVGGLNAGMAFM